MKLKFKVIFKSAFGQQIYLTGNCNELGNWDKEKAVSLNYTNESEWSVNLDFKSKNFEYLYFIKDERDQSITEEWAKRSFNNSTTKKEIVPRNNLVHLCSVPCDY